MVWTVLGYSVRRKIVITVDVTAPPVKKIIVKIVLVCSHSGFPLKLINGNV